MARTKTEDIPSEAHFLDKGLAAYCPLRVAIYEHESAEVALR